MATPTAKRVSTAGAADGFSEFSVTHGSPGQEIKKGVIVPDGSTQGAPNRLGGDNPRLC
jgi:hypothetical protein